MGQSGVTFDRQVSQGTATSGGGTFVVTIATNAAPYTDQLIRLISRVYLTEASGSHLLNSASLIAEYVIENKNNTTTAVTAIASSANPNNSGTAGMLPARPEVADTAMNTSTANWTLSTNQATLTVTNNGTGSVNANVTVITDIEMVGST